MIKIFNLRRKHNLIVNCANLIHIFVSTWLKFVNQTERKTMTMKLLNVTTLENYKKTEILLFLHTSEHIKIVKKSLVLHFQKQIDEQG